MELITEKEYVVPFISYKEQKKLINDNTISDINNVTLNHFFINNKNAL